MKTFITLLTLMFFTLYAGLTPYACASENRNIKEQAIQKINEVIAQLKQIDPHAEFDFNENTLKLFGELLWFSKNENNIYVYANDKKLALKDTINRLLLTPVTDPKFKSVLGREAEDISYVLFGNLFSYQPKFNILNKISNIISGIFVQNAFASWGKHCTYELNKTSGILIGVMIILVGLMILNGTGITGVGAIIGILVILAGVAVAIGGLIKVNKAQYVSHFY